MLTISKPLSAAQAASYHAKEFTNAKENYYSDGDTIAGRWQGRLAAAWGLSGAVSLPQFRRLTEGQDPNTGEQLIRRVAAKTYVNARGETVTTMPHRAGWDFTFSAPKTVSLVALVGGDERVRVAHRESVTVALDSLEHYVQARLGGVRFPETTRRWAAAAFEHDSARPVDGYSAPQLHTHVWVFNLTRTSLDFTRSLQPRELFRSQAYATAAYRTELARRLRELGYEIERGRSHQPDIKGFTQEYLDASSLRRKEIQDYLQAHGRAGAGAAQVAAQATRAKKLTLSREEVQHQHQELAREHGYQAQLAVERATRAQSYVIEPTRAAHDAVQYAKDRGMERSAVVEDRAVLTDAMRRSMGETTVAAIRHDFQRRVDFGEFLDRPAARGSAALAYTTPEMVALEQVTLNRLWAGQGQYASLVPHAIATATLAEHQYLNAGQRTAVQHILASRDQVTALEGRAGAGKTFAVTAIRDAAERDGYVVHGLAPTSRAAVHLVEAGMPTQTLQRFLAVPDTVKKPHLSAAEHVWRGIEPSKTLYVLDESSLASTLLMRELLDRIQPLDRVLLVGDIRQHQSVDAGKSYEQLQDAGLHGARLNTIVRQTDPELRVVVTQLSRGHVSEALTALQRMGKIHTISDRTDRLHALAADFVAQPKGTLVVSPDNQSRAEINDVIHQALQETRTVGPDHQPTRVLVPRHEMTGTDRAYADRYDVGDIVRYTKGSTTYSLEAGAYATVTGRDRATNTLTVKKESGWTVAYDPKRLQGVSVYQEQDRSFAPGDRIQFTAPCRDLRVANRQLGTLTAIQDGHASLALDAGRTLTFRIADHPHLDYGYAVTSHSSQGLTADRVLVHIDSERASEAIVNQRLAYVALSRGRYDAQIYTDNSAMLGHTLTRDVSHRAAIEQPQALQP